MGQDEAKRRVEQAPAQKDDRDWQCHTDFWEHATEQETEKDAIAPAHWELRQTVGGGAGEGECQEGHTAGHAEALPQGGGDLTTRQHALPEAPCDGVRQEQWMRRHNLGRRTHRDLEQEIEWPGRTQDQHDQEHSPPRFHRTTSSGPASRR